MYRNAKLNLENENQQLILTKEDCHVISSVMGNSYVETNSNKKIWIAANNLYIWAKI